MTREKAIQVLKDWDGYFIGHSSDDVNEALNMAIKELRKDSCNDYISRREVLEFIEKQIDHSLWAFEKLIKGIKALPSVPPKPMTGRWIVLKDEYGDIVEAVCSCCDNNGNHKYAFCPNCGAKMTESEGK